MRLHRPTQHLRQQQQPWQQRLQRQPRRQQQLVAATAVGRLGTAPADDGAADASLAEGLQGAVQQALHHLHVFYKFGRPHTMFGTFISICSVSLLALEPVELGGRALVGLVQALVPALLMNVCIVGMNQLSDIDIDRVNKPYLPLAAGEWSAETGRATVVASGVLAVLMGALWGTLPLLATLVGSGLLGVAYSVDLPGLRWKRYPVLAAGCILAVRAIMVQLGFYYHMKLAIGSSSLGVTPPLLFAIAFMLICSVVIALFKDIPDVRGDAQANVRTLSVRIGVKRVFWTCIVLLELAYAGAIGVGMMSRVWWSKWATVAVQTVMGALLLVRARRTRLDDSADIYKTYMAVWSLLYAQYCCLPLFRF